MGSSEPRVEFCINLLKGLRNKVRLNIVNGIPVYMVNDLSKFTF